MAKRFASFLQESGANALIPVPLHAARRNVRGYNQSDLLARAISRHCGIPMRSDIVVRVKNTLPMKDLTPTERQNNLKKAFHIKQNEVKLETTIIIDDIYTTGATIDAISKVLLEHGVKNIFFLTLACGVEM
jgi:ComF family protein